MAKPCRRCGKPIPPGEAVNDVHSGGTVVPWILVGPYHRDCAPRGGSASKIFTPGAVWFALAVIVLGVIALILLL